MQNLAEADKNPIMWQHFIMAQADNILRVVEKVPSIVTATAAGVGVFFAFDQNALAAWSAAIVCSGGVVANWLFSKYKELREVRRQQDNADRAALVESIRDRISAEIELASKVTQNSSELDEIKKQLDQWVSEADLRLKGIMMSMREYETLVKAKIEVCGHCEKMTISSQKTSGGVVAEGN